MRRTLQSSSQWGGITSLLIAASFFAFSHTAAAEVESISFGSTHDLAKELKNPVSSLTLLPFQFNVEVGSGEGHPVGTTLNIEPVVPINLNEDWRIITRVVAPVVYQESSIPGLDDTFGLSDTELSLFLAPVKKSEDSLLWGVGPIVEFPTTTDPLLGPEKWGIGPTAVLVKQKGCWTVGLLVNHIWSVGGAGPRDVNATFIDPWMSYTWPSGFALNLESEITYDWEDSQATVPIRAGVSQLVTLGSQPVQFNLDGLYFFEHAPEGPEWGMSFTVTFVF